MFLSSSGLGLKTSVVVVMGRSEVFCHSCGCQMFERKGKYGVFWGCSGYPTCRETMTSRDAAIRADEDSGDRHDRDEEDMGSMIDNKDGRYD